MTKQTLTVLIETHLSTDKLIDIYKVPRVEL
jgi:hypothetical protein